MKLSTLTAMAIMTAKVSADTLMHPFTVQIHSHQSDCYYELLPKHTIVTFAYEVAEGGQDFTAPVEVTDPTSTLIYENVKSRQDDVITFTTKRSGEYSFCFRNSGRSILEINFSILIEMSKIHPPAVSATAHFGKDQQQQQQQQRQLLLASSSAKEENNNNNILLDEIEIKRDNEEEDKEEVAGPDGDREDWFDDQDLTDLEEFYNEHLVHERRSNPDALEHQVVHLSGSSGAGESEIEGGRIRRNRALEKYLTIIEGRMEAIVVLIDHLGLDEHRLKYLALALDNAVFVWSVIKMWVTVVWSGMTVWVIRRFFVNAEDRSYYHGLVKGGKTRFCI